MELSKFSNKLNKLDGTVYVIEEKAVLENGVYEAVLEHDNIREKSLNVYSGSKFTGQKIDTWTLSVPSSMPWKRIIRVFAEVQEVYISYETEGDTVEAEDVNLLQEVVSNTQSALNHEEERAKRTEKILEESIHSETERAGHAEEELNNSLKEEKERAENAENMLHEENVQEQRRADAAEKLLEKSITSEIERASEEEENLRELLNQEEGRAQTAEGDLMRFLTEEVQRAQGSENNIRENMQAECERALDAEKALNTNLQQEKSRAMDAEQALVDTININRPNWDDKYTKNEIDNKFSVLETNIDWKESVDTFSDIAKIYPIPEDGWTVNVKDTDYTYRYCGDSWVAISANAIPKATRSVDGLLSKEDKISYDDADTKKHIHSNKNILDATTASYTTTEKAKLSGVAAGANNYTHPSAHGAGMITQDSSHRFVTDAEKSVWNAKQNAITIDGALSSASTNPVQNKAVTAALGGKAAAVHAHNYAGSSSAGGAATSAVKLAAARKINGIPFDGSSDITVQAQPIGWWVGTDTTNKAGWYKLCAKTMTQYEDMNLLLLLTSEYPVGFCGQLYCHARANSATITGVNNLKWMYRFGWSPGDVIAVVNGMTVTFYVYQSVAQYGRICCRILNASGRGGVSNITAYSSTDITTGLTATVTAVDGGTVNYANYAGAMEKGCTWNKLMGV